MKDDKYITFKREDWEGWTSICDIPLEDSPMSLDDAVVIRTKDPFAGPALHSYAATMALYVNLSHVNGDASDSLRRTGNYFHERALEADAAFEWKLPD